MTYRDWDKVQSQMSYKRRYDASQRALAMALRENRVHAECLEIAMEILRWYASDALVGPRADEALTQIEARLAELEEQKQ